MSYLIELTGELDFDLIRLGLSAGDLVVANICPGSHSGAMNFFRTYSDYSCYCVVWPCNFNIRWEL